MFVQRAYRKIKGSFLMAFFRFCIKPVMLFLGRRKIFKTRYIKRGEKVCRGGVLYVPGSLGLETCIVQKFDLEKHSLQRSILSAFGHGHSFLPSPHESRGWFVSENGQSIFEINTDTMEVQGEIAADGRRMGGHADLSSSGDLLYFVDRSNDVKNPESRLIIYDLERRAPVEMYDDIGIFAHDVKVTPDGKMAVVASYGEFADLYSKKTSSSKAMGDAQPSFAVIDLEKRRVILKEVISEPNVLITHLCFDQTGKNAFIQGTTLVKQSEYTDQRLTTLLQKRGDSLTHEELVKGRVFLNGLSINLDLNSLEYKLVKFPGNNRSQSLAVSHSRRELYDSYAVSQTVLVLDSGTSRIKRKIDCSAVGLREPRGLALTGDERYLIISDRWKRIFFYDCENEVFCKEKTCSSFNWMNSHISLSQN